MPQDAHKNDKTPKGVAWLFGIEANRVYCDRMIDLNNYHKAKENCISQATKSLDTMEPQLLKDELMFYGFTPDGDSSRFEEGGYAPMESLDKGQQRQAQSTSHMVSLTRTVICCLSVSMAEENSHL